MGQAWVGQLDDPYGSNLFGNLRSFYRNPSPGHARFYSGIDFFRSYFFLSLAGGLAGTAIMCGVYNSGKGPFSLVGISICGAYTHTFITAARVNFPYKTNFLFRPVAFFFITGPDYCIFYRSGRQFFIPKNKASYWVSAGPLKVSQVNPDKLILDFWYFLF